MLTTCASCTALCANMGWPNQVVNLWRGGRNAGVASSLALLCQYNVTSIPSGKARAPTVLVLSMMLSKRGGIPLGSLVTVVAYTFGQEATEGKLIAATRTRYTPPRVDARAGAVQALFPALA